MARRSSRAVRIKACELAAQAFAGQFVSGDIPAAKLMSLCVFFEYYIVNGAEVTERDMKLLSRRRVKNLKVVAGGKL